MNLQTIRLYIITLRFAGSGYETTVFVKESSAKVCGWIEMWRENKPGHVISIKSSRWPYHNKIPGNYEMLEMNMQYYITWRLHKRNHATRSHVRIQQFTHSHRMSGEMMRSRGEKIQRNAKWHDNVVIHSCTASHFKHFLSSIKS